MNAPFEQPDDADGHAPFPVVRLRGGQVETAEDTLAEEVPVALVYNGISHAVMMTSPRDLEAFALGFSLSEGIVERLGEVYEVDIQYHAEGISVELVIATSRMAALKTRRRTLAGRTGCGLCGVESLEEALPAPHGVAQTLSVTSDTVLHAMSAMQARQPLNRLTGAVHAAGWATPDGTLQYVLEDVGRHNALDKLIGTLARTGELGQPGFVLLTSRASVELVQKAAMVGIPLVATVSGPTALAVNRAQDSGVTLLGFVRPGQLSIYSHPQRIALPTA